MKRRTCLFALLALGACGTSPEPDYYTLATVSGSPLPAVAGTIKVERPALPGYLDRPEIVWQGANDSVDFAELKRWAEPLDTMFERLFAEDLRQRLPGGLIVTEQDEIPAKPRFTVENEIRQFNQTNGGYALAAQFVIKDACARAPARERAVPFHAEISAPSVTVGLSNLIGASADSIAAALHEESAALPDCTARPNQKTE